MSAIKRYIDLDSTYRDRNAFPNPSRFDSLVEQKAGENRAAGSKDPMSDDMIYETGTIGANSALGDNTVVVGNPVGTTPPLSDIADIYVGSVVVFPDESATTTPPIEFHTITQYNPITQVITFEPGLNSNLVIDNAWKFMKNKPFTFGSSQGGTTITSEIKLNASSNSVDGFYTGKYVYLLSSDEVSLITAYDGATQTATVYPPFASIVATSDVYLIYNFSSDLYSPINGFSQGMHHAILHNIELVSLIIPNRDIIYNGIPRFPMASIPYLYVRFYCLSTSSVVQFYSNNPNSFRSTFKVPLDDDNTNSIFIELKSPMVQTLKFKQNDNFVFGVYLPNGEELTYSDSDTSSPAPSIPQLQISALFAASRY
jgi:hypothetical protein